MAVDPVCKMAVEESKAAGRFSHEGRTYYFCSTRCMREFEADPAAFVRAETTPVKMDVGRSGVMPSAARAPEARPAKQLAKDPICGMKVDERQVPYRATYEEMEVFFCSAGCRDLFVQNPEHYLEEEAEPIKGSWWDRFLARLSASGKKYPPKGCH